MTKERGDEKSVDAYREKFGPLVRALERNDCSLTDEQILSVMHECGSCRENNEADHIEFARAILALAKERT